MPTESAIRDRFRELGLNGELYKVGENAQSEGSSIGSERTKLRKCLNLML